VHIGSPISIAADLGTAHFFAPTTGRRIEPADVPITA
jgi:hypothetical protein